MKLWSKKLCVSRWKSFELGEKFPVITETAGNKTVETADNKTLETADKKVMETADNKTTENDNSRDTKLYPSSLPEHIASWAVGFSEKEWMEIMERVPSRDGMPPPAVPASKKAKVEETGVCI